MKTDQSAQDLVVDIYRRDDLVEFKKIVAANPDLAYDLIGGKTFLHMACEDGKIDFVEYLYPMVQGSIFGDSAALLKEISVVDVDGNTPLLSACKGNHTEVVRFILANGGEREIGFRDNNHKLPIEIALENFNQEIVDLVNSKTKQAGVAIDESKSESKNNDLTSAKNPNPEAKNSDKERKKKKSKKPKATDQDLEFLEGEIAKNKSILSICEFGNFSDLKKFYDEKGDIFAKNSKGQGGLHLLAIRSGDSSPEVRNEVSQMFHFLLSKGLINHQEKDSDGNTSALLASKGGYPDILQVLSAENRIFYSDKNYQNQNCLHLAVDRDRFLPETEELLKILVMESVSYRAHDKHGFTPLEILKKKGMNNEAELLRVIADAIEIVHKVEVNKVIDCGFVDRFLFEYPGKKLNNQELASVADFLGIEGAADSNQILFRLCSTTPISGYFREESADRLSKIRKNLRSFDISSIEDLQRKEGEFFVKIARDLIFSGVEVNRVIILPDGSRETFLNRACDSGNFYAAAVIFSEVFRAHNSLEMLSAKSDFGENLLHKCARYQNHLSFDIASMAMSLGVSVEERNDQGLTPIQVAASSFNPNLSFIELAVDKGAKIVDLQQYQDNESVKDAVKSGLAKKMERLKSELNRPSTSIAPLQSNKAVNVNQKEPSNSP